MKSSKMCIGIICISIFKIYHIAQTWCKILENQESFHSFSLFQKRKSPEGYKYYMKRRLEYRQDTQLGPGS